MLRDVFYYGKKPNAHPRERHADSLEHARSMSTTEHFWVINEYCDYRKFDWDWDFDFLPDEDVWAQDHNNVWPSNYQKDSGTWLCPTQLSEVIVYRNDVDPVPFNNDISSNWVIFENIDKSKFDFKWHPDPASPPYIYVWGTKWSPPELTPAVEYHVPGATERMYMNIIAPLLPNKDCLVEAQKVDESRFDLAWRPDPLDPPYIYVWGNKYVPAEIQPTLEYHVPGATERKYMSTLVPVESEWDRWKIIHPVDKNTFDFTWRPDPREPDFIYVFGNNQYPGTIMPTLEYHCPGATERKYIGEEYSPKLLAQPEKFTAYEQFTNFDYSWVPDPTSPPYIYAWGNQWNTPEDKISVEYVVEGASEYRFMPDRVTRKSYYERWITPEHIDHTTFDYSWEPSPHEPPYIYQFGTQWQKTNGPVYIVEGATEVKYIDSVKAKALPTTGNWLTHEDIVDFDYSWHPDSTEEPYIYQWGNKFYSSELKPTIEYIVPGATEIKHMSQDVKLAISDKWIEHYDIDKNKFDMLWRPDPTSPPYIYKWGNKHVPVELKATLEYVVDGATEVKYMPELIEVLPEFNKWKEVQSIDKKKFDLTWSPDPREPNYIYVWGNKWVQGELKSTLEYHCPGATEYKYMEVLVEVLPEHERWKVTQEVDNFDMTWRPDPREPAYIYTWGNKHIDAELKPTIEYYCLGATERKYMGSVNVLPEHERWVEYQPVDRTKFDMTWRPDPREPAYIYVWGNKWIAGELEPTIEYHVPGATEKKYMQEFAEVLAISDRWKIIQNVENFDFSWRPDPREPDYIYVWGNKYIEGELQATIEYHCPNSTERKYMGEVDVAPEWDKWNIIIPVDKSSFDFRWRPDPREPAYIYVWGNKYNEAEREPTVEYHCTGATEIKYMNDRVATTLPNMDKWTTLIPVESFDYSWRPDPKSPPYIYVFGNKWNDATIEPTLEYKVEGATDIKYVDTVVAITKPELQYWKISNNDDLETFDFSWRPNPHSPPQIYQWADNGPRYTMPDATEVVFMERTVETRKAVVNRYKIKTTLEDLMAEHPEEVFWAINPDLSYDKFNFSWRPNEENFRHVNVFGNEYSMNTQTYYVNAPLYLMGHTEFNYVEGQTVEIDSNLSMFYIDRSNPESTERFNVLKERYPQIQKTRYLNSWVDTINRCINKSQTKLSWILNSEIDYSEFEFDFYPSPWQERMVHVFGTQWSHWGTTFMVNKESFSEDTKYVKIIEHLNVLNFVKSKRTIARNCLYPIYLIDHGNECSDTINGISVNKISYEHSYLRTFKKLLTTLSQKNEHYIWICSSVCNYENFDFSYICDPYAKDQLHVFPSDKQKFGDTFLIDVNKLRSLIEDMDMLEDYEKINYNQHQRVKRLPAPTIISGDTHCDSIQQEFDFPYAIFKTNDNKDLNVVDNEPMNLWAPNTKNIIVTSTGGSRIIVPKEAKKYIDGELYDYPYISRSNNLSQSQPLDIVFLSNGETGADENYEHLLKVTKGLRNRVVRVDGVDGRVAAYHAAAEASNTPWMFTVFAKLRVNSKFDWSWQPDRLQVPKHYIFTATNPVNKLEYGHQAMIAYNKKITLANNGTGLDFTLDNEHEVVDINSGVAVYNTDSWSTWRTAFREAIKLVAATDDMSKQRLDAWLTVGEGDFAQYSCEGARHAIEYYNQVNGDLDKLRLSYDWPWLRSYFDSKYK